MSDRSSQFIQSLTDDQRFELWRAFAGADTPQYFSGFQDQHWTAGVDRLANVLAPMLDIEYERLRVENAAMRAVRAGECSRCRFPVWSHDLWQCIPWDTGKHVGDDELRREVVLRELNQGALAGMSSEVTEQAADLVLAALNRYDAWRAEPDTRALVHDQDGSGQANGEPHIPAPKQKTED